jgi:hypothetical protein
VVRAWLRQTLFRYLLWTLSHCSFLLLLLILLLGRQYVVGPYRQVVESKSGHFLLALSAWLLLPGCIIHVALQSPSHRLIAVRIKSSVAVQARKISFVVLYRVLTRVVKRKKRGIVGQIHIWMRWGRLLITGPFTELVNT